MKSKVPYLSEAPFSSFSHLMLSVKLESARAEPYTRSRAKFSKLKLQTKFPCTYFPQTTTMNLLPLAREPSIFDKAWIAIQYPWDLVRNPLQAVLSIPALSFLVIPAFSSYGTTLNLLFFTMTWAILIKTNNPLYIEILGTFGVRFLFYILPSLGFLAFDSLTPTLAVGIKEHGDTALPMSRKNGGKNGPWWTIALVSLGNVILGVAMQTGIELLFTQGLHLQSVLKLSTALPMPWAIAKHLFLGLLLREVRPLVYIHFLGPAR